LESLETGGLGTSGCFLGTELGVLERPGKALYIHLVSKMFNSCYPQGISRTDVWPLRDSRGAGQ
jgi:hypothetical protein